MAMDAHDGRGTAAGSGLIGSARFIMLKSAVNGIESRLEATFSLCLRGPLGLIRSHGVAASKDNR